MIEIQNFSKNYSCFGMSAMEHAVGQSVLRGRPFGGVGVLVKNNLCSEIKCLICSERFVVLKLGSFIIINVYLPCHSMQNCINIVMDMP